MADTSIAIDDLVPVSFDIYGDMDPRLQRAVMRRKEGQRKPSSSSAGSDEMVVIAKVTSAAEWEALSEVRPGIAIPGDGAAGFDIVTGRVPIARIEAVRQAPCVISLKPARRLSSALAATITETGAAALPTGSKAHGGKSAIVGVVDFGCDFAHDNFRNPDGSTRLLAIWDQNAPATPTSPFGFGRMFTRAEINAALKKADPYSALGYGPDRDTVFEKGSHGTHVMDIAAGNGRGTGTPGVAPQSDLLFVEVASDDIPWSGSEVVGKSFGDSVQLLEAIQWIFDQAGSTPCAVNVSLGTNGGPHDGSTLVEIGLDRILQQRPGRSVVIAASNSFADGIHASGVVPIGGSADIGWIVPDRDSTDNELEIWYSGQDRMSVELLGPNGRSLLTVQPGESEGLTSNGRTVVMVANRQTDPNNGDNTIGLFLEGGLPAGRWTVRLHALAVLDGRYHAWIERDDAGQSQFPTPHDNSHTIGSISCGRETIVVGSYDAHKPELPLSWFSSAGPTRDGRHKPEISAPGHDVMAAWSRTKNKAIRKSGTSMAAPAVTGSIALTLSEAAARGKILSNAEIRDAVVSTARANPPAAPWNDRYGQGRVSASAMAAKAIALSPPPPPAPKPAKKKKKKK